MAQRHRAGCLRLCKEVAVTSLELRVLSVMHRSDCTCPSAGHPRCPRNTPSDVLQGARPRARVKSFESRGDGMPGNNLISSCTISCCASLRPATS